MTTDRADTLEGDLISAKHRLLEIQEQLEMKEKVFQKLKLFVLFHWTSL